MVCFVKKVLVSLGLLHETKKKVYMSDLHVLKKIEKAYGITLIETTIGNVMSWQIDHAYARNHLNQVIGLNIGDTSFSDLTPLKELTNLTNLYLVRNQIKNLNAIKELLNLTSLDLGANIIEDITPLTKLKNLTYLNLSVNLLENLTPLQNLYNLTRLVVEYNGVSDITPLKNLTNLVDLNLEENNISNLTPLKGLSNLHRLDLAKNQISDFTALKELVQLKRLDLRSNNIRQLPNWVTHFDMEIIHEELTGQCINIYDNPIEQPPIEVVRQGKQAIKNYFEELTKSDSEEYLYEAKMVLVGRGFVGKTELAKKLTIPGYHLNVNQKHTPGIDVLKRPFELTMSNLQNANVFKFNIWDFGGQDKYDATHQFFITEKSVYVFVTEARQEANYLDFDYWLNIIKLLGKNAPIIIVLSKIDDLPKQVPQSVYFEQYPNIVGFVELSCADGYEYTLDGLKLKIKEAIKKLPQLREKLPNTWVEIRKELENLSQERDYISYEDEYLPLCMKYKLNKKQANFLSRYLNALGVIIHHEDLLLKKTIIINIHWGIDGVYKVIDDKTVIEHKGIFTKEDVQRIWGEPKYNGKQAELLQLMMNYKLCFDMKDGTGYIAPELLPPDKPKGLIWNEHDTLKFQYTYDFMPAGLLGRFIVETHQLISGENYWRYGIVIEFDETQALVVEDYINHKILISVRGKNKRGLLTMIKNYFSGIHKLYENLKYHELIPCNCKDCIGNTSPTFFEHKILQQYIGEHVSQIMCTKGKIKPVEVRTLIDDVIEYRKMEDGMEKTGKGVYIENFHADGQVNLADVIDKIN